MVRLIALLLVVAGYIGIADEVEIPDDFNPIEGSAEILYSYEFDDKPTFITPINSHEFLILLLDDEDAILYIYNAKTDTTEKKSEFLVNEDENFIEHKIYNGKLILRFRNSSDGSLFGLGSNDGHYWRETIVNLKTYMPESSRIYYTTLAEDDFKFEDYNNDLVYADTTFDKSLFIKGLDEKDIDPEDFRYLAFTYNEADSNRKNIFHLVIDDNNYTMYGVSSNYYKFGDLPDINMTVIQDSAEDYKYITFQYSYLDDKSNLYFVMSWLNDDLEKRYISVNMITPDGKITQKIKEVNLEIDGDDYMYRRFERISMKNNRMKLFGVSRYTDGEAQELAAISSLCVLDFDMSTLEFEFKEKTFTEDEGELVNKEEGDFRFNKITKVIEKDGGYVVLAENNKLHVYVSTSKYGNVTYTYYYLFNDINLFALDNELKVKWNNFIDREAKINGGIYGNPSNSYFGTSDPVQVNLIPTVTDNEISFIYSTTEPEDEIRRIKYNTTTGEKVEEVSLFQNDGVPSYFPGYQFPIGNNEFVTLLKLGDNNVVKYKLLK